MGGHPYLLRWHLCRGDSCNRPWINVDDYFRFLSRSQCQPSVRLCLPPPWRGRSSLLCSLFRELSRSGWGVLFFSFLSFYLFSETSTENRIIMHRPVPALASGLLWLGLKVSKTPVHLIYLFACLITGGTELVGCRLPQTCGTPLSVYYWYQGLIFDLLLFALHVLRFTCNVRREACNLFKNASLRLRITTKKISEL